jgi:hypothetical protein
MNSVILIPLVIPSLFEIAWFEEEEKMNVLLRISRCIQCLRFEYTLLYCFRKKQGN